MPPSAKMLVPIFCNQEVQNMRSHILTDICINTEQFLFVTNADWNVFVKDSLYLHIF